MYELVKKNSASNFHKSSSIANHSEGVLRSAPVYQNKILPRSIMQLQNNTVIQKKTYQYTGEGINDFLDMPITFDTQGIKCIFDSTEKHGANWISKTSKVKAWSNDTHSHQQFAIHLNITFSGIFYNDTTREINITISDIHWTIRSLEDQLKIDNQTSTDNTIALHKSTGAWNTSKKDTETRTAVFSRIGGDPTTTAINNIDINITKEDLRNALTDACQNTYAQNAVVNITMP